MKIEKIKYILPIIFITMLLVTPKVYAKTSIEIKPSNTVYTNKTISEFFDESLAMKNEGEALEGTNVDVHMATNTDWAIVSYFSNSQYGTNGAGKNTGVTVPVNGTNYLSTNGNITGVMNFGKTSTFTAGVISNYAEIDNTATVYANGKSIIANATNNKYVDLIYTVPAKDKGLIRWYSVWLGQLSKSSPYTARAGLFGLYGIGITQGAGNGSKDTTVTFRPVIWN